MQYNSLFSVGSFWKVFFLSCSFFYLEKVSAQEVFSFSLFLEDAQGNKDTLTIGYDDLASDEMDNSFGEFSILNEPWENELDARIGDRYYSIWNGEPTWINENSYLTKKQILKSYCIDTFFSSRITIQFHTTHYPLKLKWDKSLFQNQACHQNSVFFGALDNIHFDALMGDLLAFQDSIIIQPFTASQLGAEEKLYTFFQLPHVDTLTPFYALHSYESAGKEIGAIQFQFYRTNLLQNADLPTEKQRVFPNPTNGGVHISNNIKLDFVHVYTLDGSLVFRSENPASNFIDLSELENGIYFVQWNQTAVEKVVLNK